MGQGLIIEDKSNHTLQNLILDGGMVLCIYEDRMQHIWVTTDRDVYRFRKGNPDEKTAISTLRSLPDSLRFRLSGPYAICEDEKNRIWVGLRTGLFCMEEKAGDYKVSYYDFANLQQSPFPKDNITAFYYQAEISSLWVGTRNSGLYQLLFSPQGEPASFQHIKGPDKHKEEHIWCMASYGETFLAGTDNGLKEIVFNSDTVFYKEATRHPKLSTYKIMAITKDPANQLWLNTSRGLFKFDPETEHAREFLHSDGLTSNTLTEGAFYDREEGVLYIGSVDGINRISPERIAENPYLPQVQFTNLYINNQQIHPQKDKKGKSFLSGTINYTDILKLSYKENNITVDFVSLHYSNPSKNKIAYILEGFNSDWTTISNETGGVTYTNIPPGKYRLQIKGSNCDGVWSPEVKELAIIIKPAWWNTTWAYIGYLLFFCCVVSFILFHLFRQQQLKKGLP